MSDLERRIQELEGIIVAYQARIFALEQEMIEVQNGVLSLNNRLSALETQETPLP